MEMIRVCCWLGLVVVLGVLVYEVYEWLRYIFGE